MLHTVPTDGTAVSLPADAPYTILPGSLASGILLVCDHADNAFPPGYDTLGLPAAQLQRHIAYDPGAAGITRHMARILGAPAVLTRYSRLLIDPNRDEDDPTLIMRISDGAVVPGNAALTREERQNRLDRYYRPYHNAIDQTIDAMMAAGKPPVIFSIHSFTENWRGWMRPWHAGVLWDKDPRLARPLIDALRKDPVFVIGDNEPYTGALRGDCVHKHATVRGLANALIEVRQDLILDDAGQAEWAERFSGILEALLAKPNADATFHAIRYYGSRTDRAASCANGRIDREDGMTKAEIDPKLAVELEAAAFRRLVAHLREHSDVQNIDMMNLAGFCRNCLSNWFQDARGKRHRAFQRSAREIIYGMPYDEWKDRYQTEASSEQRERFQAVAGEKNH